MSAERFFHCCQIPLAPGAVIEPGTWGRIINLNHFGDTGSMFTAYRETVLESYRREHCPQKPSRLDGLFGCPDEASMRIYHSAHAPRNLIYEVETVEDEPAVHQGDYMMALFPQPTPPAMQYFREFPLRAADYWSDNGPKPFPEVIAGCAVRVLRRL